MLLAAILWLCSVPQTGDTVKAETDSPTASGVSRDSSLSQPLPSAPEPKIKADEDASTGPETPNEMDSALVAGGVTPAPAPAIEPNYAPVLPRLASMSKAPLKPLVGRPYETATQRKLWYALSFAGSGAAAFDAWSTRRAITQGYGVEGNPMLRPFSHSGALYAATQVSPLVMDFLGKRMMLSQHRILRRMWWLPQAAGTSVSLTAGVHNVRLVP
jgi:hypothetical protein